MQKHLAPSTGSAEQRFGIIKAGLRFSGIDAQNEPYARWPRRRRLISDRDRAETMPG